MDDKESKPQPQANPAPPKKPGEKPQAKRRKFFQRPVVIVIGAILAAFIVFYGAHFIIHSQTHESTDDAFIQADNASLAPRVSGQVRALHVDDNQQVRRGELLLEIDPRDYEAIAAQKRAALQAAKTSLQTAQANLLVATNQIQSALSTLAQRQAEVSASQAVALRSQSDFVRNEKLLANQTISPSEFDAFRATANSNNAALEAARKQAAAARSSVDQARAQFTSAQADIAGAQARVKQAAADLEAAELNLSYTKIYSPIDGRVTHRTVDVGDYLQVGQNIMAIVPLNVYVVANFKETQLAHMRPGQPAAISVDAYSGKTYRGRVDSIQAGSGANFSLLPPENAVGNYVKVVQRVPVKIVFDGPPATNHVVGPGLSVVPSVTIRNFNIPSWLLLLFAIVIGFLVAAWGFHHAATARQTA